MSYEIIKAIGIKNNEVWITSYSSNVTPRTPNRWHCKSLTKILVEQGKEAYEKEVLKEYWSGNFQNTGNMFDKVVTIFKKNNPDYTWGSVGHKKSEDGKPDSFGDVVKYTYEELMVKLHEAYLAFKNRKKEKLVIRVMVDQYITKLGKRSCQHGMAKERAKVFNSREEAELASDTLKYAYKDMEPEIIPA